MTLRQYLRRKSLVYAWWGFPVLMLLFGAGAWADVTHRGHFVVVIGPLIVIMILGSVAIRRMKCPRCGRRLGELGRLAYFATIPTRGLRSRDYYGRLLDARGQCPHCGLGLDEAIPAGSTAGTGSG